MSDSHNKLTVFLIDPDCAAVSKEQDKESCVMDHLVASILASELPHTSAQSLSAIRDAFQWGHKFALTNNKVSRNHEAGNGVAFDAESLRRFKTDLDAKVADRTRQRIKFDPETISENVTVMLHDYEWDRVEVTSPVKKTRASLHRKNLHHKHSTSFGVRPVDEQQRICHSHYSHTLANAADKSNVFCIVGPVPNDIQGKMRALYQKRGQNAGSAAVTSFLLKHNHEFLSEKIQAKLIWVNTNPEKVCAFVVVFLFSHLSLNL